MELTPLTIVILGIVGFATSYVQERFGKFEQIDNPGLKQFITALTTFVAPAIVSFLAPYWRTEFGDALGFINYVVFLLAPVVVWVGGQVGHQIDKLFKSATQANIEKTK